MPWPSSDICIPWQAVAGEICCKAAALGLGAAAQGVFNWVQGALTYTPDLTGYPDLASLLRQHARPGQRPLRGLLHARRHPLLPHQPGRGQRLRGHRRHAPRRGRRHAAAGPRSAAACLVRGDQCHRPGDQRRTAGVRILAPLPPRCWDRIADRGRRRACWRPRCSPRRSCWRWSSCC